MPWNVNSQAMFNRIIPLVVFLFIPFASGAQRKENIHLPGHNINSHLYQSIIKFIPAGYTVLDQVDGDLNSDGLIDKILILKQKNEMTEEEKRPVLLLIRQKDHSLKNVTENANIVLSLGDGGIHGDPYHGITVKHGYFSIEHFGGSGWRWSQVITFKYDKKLQNWFLYKIGDEYWHIDYPTSLKHTVKTKSSFGVVPFSDYKNESRGED